MTRLSTYTLYAVVVVVVAASGCKDTPADDCEKAVARSNRLRAADSLPPDPQFVTINLIAQCRRAGTALYDPVLRCLLDSATDDAAASCIDEGMESVVGPSTNGSDDPGGSGLNPLLMPEFSDNGD